MEHGVQVTVMNYAVLLECRNSKEIFQYTCHLLLLFFFFFAALVAEVTQPSLGVGYELGRAIENKKKILCLFRPDCGKCKLVNMDCFQSLLLNGDFLIFCPCENQLGAQCLLGEHGSLSLQQCFL